MAKVLFYINIEIILEIVTIIVKEEDSIVRIERIEIIGMKIVEEDIEEDIEEVLEVDLEMDKVERVNRKMDIEGIDRITIVIMIGMEVMEEDIKVTEEETSIITVKMDSIIKIIKCRQ